jgi:hypothetical protein
MTKCLDIDCIIVKILKVPSPGYGIVYIVHTLKSIPSSSFIRLLLVISLIANALTSFPWSHMLLGTGRRNGSTASISILFYRSSWAALWMTSLFTIRLTLSMRSRCSWIERKPWPQGIEIAKFLAMHCNSLLTPLGSTWLKHWYTSV